MEQVSVEMLLFIMAAGFLASFIDSVVGGGGLISIPALLLTGLPSTVVLGTNKLASTMSSCTSTLSFIRSGKVNIKLVAWLFPLSLVGSALGAYTVTKIPPEFLKPLVIILLILVSIYTLFKKNWGTESTYKGLTKGLALFAIITAFVIGFYDGFFGPGTGSFLLFSFLLMGFDFVGAAGNSKVLNFASNIAGLVTFMVLGSVNYQYGIPMGLAMIAGALVGTQVAIRKGAAYVKPLFISITALLIGKQIWDMLH
ncbi:TSUP family transporter [Aneurinibacillus thermoaerophilus]|uniref:TSUP family transporter n=1 Tax=Aneurinibacillus thermoaerophilus TaxID=143495 RepID=UPI002E23C4AC|nr:TSUP family transporter [Aneurinibacillus thermoaerophilus]MED0758471.1 TSUP family transporter [Aneurinibacillus thermoaerophilus]MED0762185.1 TSUP family transporter [Aneurinibacillus thermoaerophilus]